MGINKNIHNYRLLGKVKRWCNLYWYMIQRARSKIEKGKLSKCIHELPSRGDIYGRVKRPELKGVTFEFVLYMGVIDI